MIFKLLTLDKFILHKLEKKKGQGSIKGQKVLMLKTKPHASQIQFNLTLQDLAKKAEE